MFLPLYDRPSQSCFPLVWPPCMHGDKSIHFQRWDSPGYDIVDPMLLTLGIYTSRYLNDTGMLSRINPALGCCWVLRREIIKQIS